MKRFRRAGGAAGANGDPIAFAPSRSPIAAIRSDEDQATRAGDGDRRTRRARGRRHGLHPAEGRRDIQATSRTREGGTHGTQAIDLACRCRSRCARRSTRRRRRIGGTTGCNRRDWGHPLEPGRGEHTRRDPGPERRCSTRVPDQHGHGAGRRLRRRQRDRAQAASAVSAQQARWCEGVDRRCRRNSRVRRADRARLQRAGASSVPRSRRAPDARSPRSSQPRSLRSTLAPSRSRASTAGHAAAAAMLDARWNDGRFGPSQWVPNTAAGHWWPLSMRPGSRSSTRRRGSAG